MGPMKVGEKIEQFPCLVVHLMAAVYNRYPIEFGWDDNRKPDLQTLTLFEPNPFDENGKLTAECRRKLIELIGFEAKESGFRMCVVFSPREVVYVEPEGAIQEASQPPIGGVDIGPFEGVRASANIRWRGGP